MLRISCTIRWVRSLYLYVDMINLFHVAPLVEWRENSGMLAAFEVERSQRDELWVKKMKKKGFLVYLRTTDVDVKFSRAINFFFTSCSCSRIFPVVKQHFRREASWNARIKFDSLIYAFGIYETQSLLTCWTFFLELSSFLALTFVRLIRMFCLCWCQAKQTHNYTLKVLNQ